MGCSKSRKVVFMTPYCSDRPAGSLPGHRLICHIGTPDNQRCFARPRPPQGLPLPSSSCSRMLPTLCGPEKVNSSEYSPGCGTSSNWPLQDSSPALLSGGIALLRQKPATKKARRKYITSSCNSLGNFNIDALDHIVVVYGGIKNQLGSLCCTGAV